jgi:glycosyltransferase involved in cell wall biosynthesis
VTRVAFVVNGPPAGAMGHRARAFAAHLGGAFTLRLLYRRGGKGLALARFLGALTDFAPHVCYVFDMAAAGVGAGGLYKHLTRCRLVIDTGDAVGELARSLGRGPLGVRLTRHLEGYGLKAADRIVVRGTYHRQWLAEQGIDAAIIPDGVETDRFTPRPEPDLRRQLGLEGRLVVGLVGSSVWSEALQLCYGWDLVELIRLLRDAPVAGVMIGGGTGIPVLQARCRDYGIEDRVRFLGYTPYEELPRYLNAMDVCLSTQSNDLVGQVRTTGKLPLYLACGRYILASRVGEAARVLPGEMLVDYAGTVDRDYPGRLAEHVRALLAEPGRLGLGLAGVETARAYFDYRLLAERVGRVLGEVSRGHRRARQPVPV